MDANLVQQIYPLIRYAENTIPNLQYADKEALTADLYLGIASYYNKDIQKYLDRLQRLELLKKDKSGHIKEQKFLDNIKKQQDSILEESKDKQNHLLNDIYSKWLANLEKENG